MTLKYIILLFLIYFFPMALADDLTGKEILVSTTNFEIEYSK